MVHPLGTPFGGNFPPNFLAGSGFGTQSGIRRKDVPTSLGNVQFAAPTSLGRENFGDIDALIKARTPQALSLLGQGSEEALRLSENAQLAGTGPLQQFTGLEAFGEQNALLGLSGTEAQQAAIAGIPVSEFDQELNRRQREQQLRSSFAGGDVSGASLQGAQQLAGGQQANIIQQRLGQLEPLVAAARGARSTISGIDEAARARQAQLLTGRGVGEANIRLGTAAPLISSTLQRAELSGLQGISAANQRAQQQNQLASLAGQFAPQIGSAVGGFFNQPTQQPIGLTTFQTDVSGFA